MFELSATKFEKGIFELTLAKKPPAWLAPFIWLGPIRSRLLALALILGAGSIYFFSGPTHGLLATDATSFATAYKLQKALWIPVLLGIVVWATAFYLRREELVIGFDRGAQNLKCRHTPMGAKNPVVELDIPFGDIKAIEVFSATRGTPSPFGYVEVRTKVDDAPFKALRFKLLSDDQFRIYPQNLAKMTGIEAQGDV
jgi:hypothetical protein